MSPHNSRHGTTCSISSRNTCRRVFFVYHSKPFIVARLLCCLFVDLIWRNLLYIPVERETLFRVFLADTPNNWVQVVKIDDAKYVAEVGKETFHVEIKVSLVDGKI